MNPENETNTAPKNTSKIPLTAGVLAGALVLVGIVVGVFLIANNQTKKDATTEQGGFLSESEILKRLAFFDRASNRQRATEGVFGLGGTKDMAGIYSPSLQTYTKEPMDLLTGGYYLDDYQNGLMHTSTRIEYGDGTSFCKPYYPYGLELRSYEYEDYYYSGSEGTHGYKWIEYYPDLETVSISTNQYWMLYMGGSYAVKENYIGGLDSSPEEMQEYYDDYDDRAVDNAGYDPSLADLFGDGAELEGPVERDGKYYYVVTYSGNASWYCNTGDSDVGILYSRTEGYGAEDVIVYKIWINAVTGEWEITEDYFNKVDKDNLIVSRNSETDFAPGDWEKFAGVFEFTIDVPVEEYEYDRYGVDLDYKQMIMYTDILILVFKDPGDLFVDHYNYYDMEADDILEYWNDRDFYPEGETGDIMFEANNYEYSCESCEGYPVIKHYMSFGNLTTNCSGGMSAYASTFTEEEIEKYFLPRDEGEELIIRPVKVKVGSAELSGKEYRVMFTEEYITAIEDSSNVDDGSVDFKMPRSYGFLLFVYDGATYLVNEYCGDVDEISPELMDFYVLDVDNEQDVDAFVEELEANKDWWL